MAAPDDRLEYVRKWMPGARVVWDSKFLKVNHRLYPRCNIGQELKEFVAQFKLAFPETAQKIEQAEARLRETSGAGS